MELGGQEKEIEMPTPLSYNPPNRDSSSKLSSPTLPSTVGERSDLPDQTQTIFSNLSRTSGHHLPYFPPPSPLSSNQHQQSPRPRRDLDPSLSPIATTTTSITSTLVVTGSNPRAASSPLIRYRECLKNHAASLGSHVVDGCGEFMPSGEEGTLESLICAACECHRNFHRKETEGEPQHISNYYSSYPKKINGQNRIPSSYPPFPLVPSSLHHHHRFSHRLATPSAGPIPPLVLAFGGGPVESSSEDLNMFQSITGAQPSVQPPLSKKRFRTKFTQQQKDRMMEFAEKLGWKIQNHDEQEVQQFCSQVGVKRQIFKIWMHNNKQARKKQHM